MPAGNQPSSGITQTSRLAGSRHNRQFKSDMQHYAQLFWHCSPVTPTIKNWWRANENRKRMYLLLAAISITFAAVSGAYHLEYSNCWRSFCIKKMFLCRNKCLLANPRAAYSCCAVSGRGAAGAGTTFQGMFRNPLVSPDI